MRRIPRYCIAVIGLMVGSLLGIHAAFATSSDNSAFVSKINYERSSRGIGTLAWSQNLANIAQRHSQEMADEQDLHHNQNLPNEVSGWQMLGENVGYGPTVGDLHTAFMNSPEHRDNILEPQYTLVGIGTVWSQGTLWVTEVFERPMNASSSQVHHHVHVVTHHVQTGVQAQSQSVAPVRPRPAVRPKVSGMQKVQTPVGDLTRFMIEDVLSNQDPAAESVLAPPALSQGDGSYDVIAMTFQPFAQLAGRVSRDLLRKAAANG